MQIRTLWNGAAGSSILWIASVIVALGIGAAGATKLLQPENWRTLFLSWGYPASFSPVAGAIEMCGAIGMLIPAISLYAAALLSAVMVVALATLLRHPGGPMGWGLTPIIYLTLLAIVASGRLRRRRT